MAGRKSYHELITFKTFEERCEYLRINQVPFEHDPAKARMILQRFYQYDRTWKLASRDAIIRDNACDLGIIPIGDWYDPKKFAGRRPIDAIVFVHHINPITSDDVLNHSPDLYNPDNLICTSHATHQYIHYGFQIHRQEEFVERSPNDTSPWLKSK